MQDALHAYRDEGVGTGSNLGEAASRTWGDEGRAVHDGDVALYKFLIIIILSLFPELIT
jgi:hypothetical protein